jgi:hypothetical protein
VLAAVQPAAGSGCLQGGPGLQPVENHVRIPSGPAGMAGRTINHYYGVEKATLSNVGGSYASLTMVGKYFKHIPMMRNHQVSE